MRIGSNSDRAPADLREESDALKALALAYKDSISSAAFGTTSPGEIFATRLACVAATMIAAWQFLLTQQRTWKNV